MKLNIVCEKHPKYKAVHYPRPVNCDACEILYFLKNRVSGSRKVGVKLIGLAADPPVLTARKARK